MVVCLFLQSLLLVAVVHYYRRHENLIRNPSIWASMVVIKSVMLILLAGNLAQISNKGVRASETPHLFNINKSIG